ncbi:MAG TPA: hypothetical protein VF020_19645, partial [Chthoniobacterales bacterium]
MSLDIFSVRIFAQALHVGSNLRKEPGNLEDLFVALPSLDLKGTQRAYVKTRWALFLEFSIRSLGKAWTCRE